MKKLDLHRMRHEDAQRAVIRFVEFNWGCGEEVEIITGNSMAMKEIVVNVLKEYDLEYTYGRLFDINKGYIVTCLE